MRIAQEPLSESEVAQLRQMLADTGSRSLEYARGVFTSSATSPTKSVPTDWLPLLLGKEIPSQEALDETFALLMREYNSVCDCLYLGVPVVPAAHQTELIREFCQGYIRVVQKSDRWKLDKEAFALLVPVAVLSEYVSGEALKNLAPEFAENPAEWTAKQREELTETLMQSYAYWDAARKEPPPVEAGSVAEQEVPAPLLGAPKVGRNDLCPCKSGKKYKKCCGAPS